MANEKTIGELLDEARCRSGAEQLRGHDIMDLMRFAEATRHMVVFEVLSDEAGVGFKGDRMRLFLTETGYRNLLEKEQRGMISKKNHALVISGHLIYDDPHHNL